MREVEQLTDLKFVNIKKVVDKEKNVNGYLFAERLGVDSVAFVCYDWHRDIYLVNNEYKPPIDDFVLGAFGGSIDKDASKVQIVVDEVREEAGFDIFAEDVEYIGKYLVSTQMNQYCYLYVAHVSKDEQLERRPENAIEAMAETKWISGDDFLNLNDWKAITIYHVFSNQQKRFRKVLKSCL